MRPAQEIMSALACSGLTSDQLALVMELSAAVATEARPVVDTSAMRRRARDRQYQAERRQSRPKSADAPPKERSIPPSDPEGSGSAPDAKKEFWDRAVAILKAGGETDRSARSMIGKWCKAHGEPRTKEVLDAAAGKAGPVAYAEAMFARPKSDLDGLIGSIERKYPMTTAG